MQSYAEAAVGLLLHRIVVLNCPRGRLLYGGLLGRYVILLVPHVRIVRSFPWTPIGTLTAKVIIRQQQNIGVFVASVSVLFVLNVAAALPPERAGNFCRTFRLVTSEK